jgi:hypothetical protein
MLTTVKLTPGLLIRACSPQPAHHGRAADRVLDAADNLPPAGDHPDGTGPASPASSASPRTT